MIHFRTVRQSVKVTGYLNSTDPSIRKNIKNKQRSTFVRNFCDTIDRERRIVPVIVFRRIKIDNQRNGFVNIFIDRKTRPKGLLWETRNEREASRYSRFCGSTVSTGRTTPTKCWLAGGVHRHIVYPYVSNFPHKHAWKCKYVATHNKWGEDRRTRDCEDYHEHHVYHEGFPIPDYIHPNCSERSRITSIIDASPETRVQSQKIFTKKRSRP